MVIYIEYVLVNNFIIDFFLLLLTCKIVGLKYKVFRLMIGAVMGGGLALLFPLLDFNNTVMFFIKILSGLLLLVISATFRSKKETAYSFIVFLCLTFLMGGCILGGSNLLKRTSFSELFIAVMFLPVLLIIKFCEKLNGVLEKRKNIAVFTYKVCVSINGKKKYGIGFLDSGNCVYYENAPVCFCGKAFIKNIMGIHELKSIKTIKIDTVNGTKERIVIKVSYLEIYINGQVHRIDNVNICLIEKIKSNYDIILHPSLIGGNNEYNIKDKRVS